MFPISTLTPSFGWNISAGRYVDLRTGRFVSFTSVRDALEFTIDASQAKMHTLTEQLIAEEISRQDWFLGMMKEIRIAHTASAAAARGGWAQMSQADWGAVGPEVRRQYDYLRNFANEIASGKQPLNGSALVRTDLYGQAARGSFEEMRRRYERLYQGMEEERRILGDADHCTTRNDLEGCLELSRAGWQPIMSLPRIGESPCRTNCHCRFIYRRNDNGHWAERE